MPAFKAETSIAAESGKRALLTAGFRHRTVIMHWQRHLPPALTTAVRPSLAHSAGPRRAMELSARDEAGSRNTAKALPLVGRKSVLMGMLASGFLVANVAQPSAMAGTVKPSSIAATPSLDILKWAPSTSYLLGRQVVSPNNDVVSAKATHTSSTAYTTDTLKWDISRTYAGPADTGLNALKNGCVGNGITDDTAALNSIRASAAAMGVPVFLPQGTYLVTALTLSVAGQSWVLAKGAVIKQKAGTTTISAVIITAAGVTFSGGKIDGNKVNQTYQWSGGITSQAANVTIDSVEVTNCYASGINLEAGSVGNLIKNNYCHDNGKDTNAADGILLGSATYCRVIGNRCEYNGSGGGANEASYDGNGIQDFTPATITTHNLIANNQCSWNARRGIKIQAVGTAVIGNMLAGNSCGIGLTDLPGGGSSGQVVISGNTITNSYLQGLQLDNCQFVTVTGNQIVDSGSHGIGVYLNAVFVQFTGNTVIRSGGNGMNLNGCNNWTISGNTFLDCGDGMIVMACTRMNVNGNTVGRTSGTQPHGIQLTGSGDRINLVGNMVGAGVTTGYTVAGTNVTQTGNM
jgi:hypothetical protein